MASLQREYVYPFSVWKIQNEKSRRQFISNYDSATGTVKYSQETANSFFLLKLTARPMNLIYHMDVRTIMSFSPGKLLRGSILLRISILFSVKFWIYPPRKQREMGIPFIFLALRALGSARIQANSLKMALSVSDVSSAIGSKRWKIRSSSWLFVLLSQRWILKRIHKNGTLCT